MQDEDDAHSDDEIRPTDDGPIRPAQAERKRELERNRRNLVNVRFSELEAELRRCAPHVDTLSQPTKACAAPKSKRIDKEAVLKEAAQRLAVQRTEIAAITERLGNMTAEIDNLRAEKVELRSEKAYLRDELQTVRGDVQRLRSDNINLWQAVKKQSSVKSMLAADVAKLPAELFCRPKPQEQLPLVPIDTGIHSTHVESAAHLPRTSSVMTHQVPPTAPNNTDADHANRTINSDNFLVYQSAEELGELFANYIPGSIGNVIERTPLSTQAATATPGLTENEVAAIAAVQAQALQALQNMPVSQAQLIFDMQQQGVADKNRPQPIFQNTTRQDETDKTSKADAAEKDPFSDIAYCV